jgi:Flp pilus assembly protein TadG
VRAKGGQSLVEFALVAPLLVFFLLAVIYSGLMFNQYLQVTAATNTSAVLLSESRGETTDPCNTISQAVYSAAPTLTQSQFTFSFVLNTTTYNTTSCSGAQSNLIAGDTAQVTVHYPCDAYFIKINPSCLLAATTKVRVQ